MIALDTIAGWQRQDNLDITNRRVLAQTEMFSSGSELREKTFGEQPVDY